MLVMVLVLVLVLVFDLFGDMLVHAVLIVCHLGSRLGSP
jgi:hypothetical protein